MRNGEGGVWRGSVGGWVWSCEIWEAESATDIVVVDMGGGLVAVGGGVAASLGGGAIVAVGASVTVFFCFVDSLRKIRLRKDCVCDFVVVTSMFGTKKVGSSQRYHDALEGPPCFICKISGIGYTFNSHIP